MGNDSPYPINIYKLNDLIECFIGTKGEPGIIFTLNQDLFIERKFTGNKAMLELPSVKRIPEPGGDRNRTLQALDYITLPTKEEIQKAIKNKLLFTGNLYYIKLHGSFNWKSHDGSHRLVIGLDKERIIGREPLLN